MRSFILATALILAGAPALAETLAPPVPEDVSIHITGATGQTIEVRQGENFAIELQSSPSTGSSWAMTAKPDFVDEGGQATGPVNPPNPNGRPVLGAPRWQVFMLTANAQGSGDVTLELRGPGGVSRATFTVTINAQ